MDAVVNAVMMLIVRDYSSPTDIPPHSRWRHFEAASAAMKLAKCDRINPLLESWKKEMSKRQVVIPPTERADWGVGKDKAASSYNRARDWHWHRSSGSWLADCRQIQTHIPCVQMPLGSQQSPMSRSLLPFKSTTFQPISGCRGRCLLLNRLGDVCAKHTEYFGSTPASNRPGNLVDYLLDHSSTLHSDDGQSHTVDISLLWHVAMDAFAGVWPPSRTSLDGVFLGDVWPCRALAAILAARSTESSTESTTESTTGRPSNRTCRVPYGGLFVDMGVISLRDSSIHMRSQGPESVPRFNVFDDAVVEWRALTVGLLDMVADCVRKRLSLSKDQLPLAKVLEAGTWKAGREIAASLRPITRGPPIDIISDGTVF
ncbi:hypothetical protein BASA61_004239 [Batrachochytrium salamandrivorans]|nr:hypothetical protein BASA61_004239 [Batrachochytrium salamandrivorans]